VSLQTTLCLSPSLMVPLPILLCPSPSSSCASPPPPPMPLSPFPCPPPPPSGRGKKWSAAQRRPAPLPRGGPRSLHGTHDVSSGPAGGAPRPRAPRHSGGHPAPPPGAHFHRRGKKEKVVLEQGRGTMLGQGLDRGGEEGGVSHWEQPVSLGNLWRGCIQCTIRMQYPLSCY